MDKRTIIKKDLILTVLFTIIILSVFGFCLIYNDKSIDEDRTIINLN